MAGSASAQKPGCSGRKMTPQPWLGRLWDIDVLTPEGEILSRRDYSLPPRRCLLCEQSAAVCARGKTHQLTDLLNRMEALLNDVDACNVN